MSVETRESEAIEVEVAAVAEAPLRLERGVDGQLRARDPDGVRAVRVIRCFPWSEPRRYFSIRDLDDDEVAIVREARDLDPASQKALEEALVEAGFVLEVAAILEIEEEIEIRTWKVRTVQGIRSFQTPRDEGPRAMPGGGLLVSDVAGDLYHVARPHDLDARSQRLLWAFVD